MKKYFYLIILLFCFNSNIYSQAFSLDTTFNINYDFYAPWGDVDPAIYGLNFEPDGKLMIYGYFFDGATIADIIRVSKDGSIDNSWNYMGGNGVEFLQRLDSSYINESENDFEKVNYIGQYIGDTSWSNNMIRANICAMYFYPYIFTDGSLLVGSDTACNVINNKKSCLRKFLPNGIQDTNFRHSTNSAVFGITKYSSDKLLLYGGGQNGFTKYDTIPANVMCRIDTLGNLDTTFKSIFVSGYSNPIPYYIQNDGKIIVVGGFYINNNNQYQTMIRLNPNGSLDSTFNNFNSLTYPDGVVCVCPTSDNGYLIGGGFKNYQGYSRNNICKTDINGFIDTNYFNGEGIDSCYNEPNCGNSVVSCIKKDTNDTYYVMGYFTYYNGVHVNPIIRLKGISAGINEIKQEQGFVKVYPNPTKDNLTIETNENTEQKIEILTLIGQTVYTSTINNKTIVNTSAFANGVYILKLSSDKETVVRKFVKE